MFFETLQMPYGCLVIVPQITAFVYLKPASASMVLIRLRTPLYDLYIFTISNDVPIDVTKTSAPRSFFELLLVKGI